MDPKIVDLLQPGPFREFLASKPADETYVFDSPRNCPIAQYLAAAGAPASFVGVHLVYSRVSGIYREADTAIPEGWSNALRGDESHVSQTYGQALARFNAIPAAG